MLNLFYYLESMNLINQHQGKGGFTVIAPGESGSARTGNLSNSAAE